MVENVAAKRNRVIMKISMASFARLQNEMFYFMNCGYNGRLENRKL
jgi:hypothetical protein